MPPPVIGPEQASWMIQGAASMVLATHDGQQRPMLANVHGARISLDLQVVTVFLDSVESARVLPFLRGGMAVAVVFTNSRSTRSLQLKAEAAREVPLRPGDDERSTAHVGALAREWGDAGLPEAHTRTIFARRGELVAFELSPYVAFDQTPGPRAGTPLS